MTRGQDRPTDGRVISTGAAAPLARYRNQYLVVMGQREASVAGLHPVHLGPVTLLPGPALSWVFERAGERWLLLIGEALDPCAPTHDNRAIAAALLAAGTAPIDAIARAQALAGRFVVLTGDRHGAVAFSDAMAQRQIHYAQDRQDLVLSSSPALAFDYLGWSLELSPAARSLMASALWEHNEGSWVGDGYLDTRLRKVLPNHALHLPDARVERFALGPPPVSGREAILDYAATTLRQTIAAMAHRQPLIQAITAGWDSRLLLAASRAQREQIRYFVFDTAGAPPSMDARVAADLAQRLGLRFERIERPALRADFLAAYRAEHLLPRVMYTTSHVQYLADAYPDGVINVNGNGGEIARCAFGTGTRRVTLNMLEVFTGYGRGCRNASHALQRWMTDAAPVAAASGIYLLDLLEWEEFSGNWASLAPLELDQAVETITPFNNRALQLSLLQLPARERAGPRSPVFRELVRRLWPEVPSDGINPQRRPLMSWAKTRTPLYYRMKWLDLKLRYRV